MPQDLPITNIINVSVTDTPQGILERNVNSVALFTTESSGSLDVYDIYLSAAQVAADYGSSSITAAMANAILSQSPNILSGSGQLVVIPLLHSVSATTGHTTTANISANITNIVGVTAGDLKVTLNTVVHNLTNINFTRCVTIGDIAGVLQGLLPDTIITNDATTITITSKKVGTISDVQIGQVSGGGGTDLSGAGYFISGSQTHAAGANSSGETISQAIARTENVVSYVATMTNLQLEDGAISTIASTVEARDMMFLHQVASSEDILGIGLTIQEAGQKKTRILLYTTNLTLGNLMKAAYTGRGFSTDFTGSNTATTLHLKKLAGVDPDKGITQTMADNCKTAGVDFYASYPGFSGVYSTGGNDYFDNPYSDLALKFALEAAGFNYLAQTNTKIPQTESGMDGLKSAYSQTMEQFIRNGEFAPGAWDSSETFGNPEVFRGNISLRGYYIYSLPVAQQSVAQRDGRIAPLVQIAAKRAGAIQSSNVLVVINN